MDGEVIIKVSADTKNFDSKLQELEKKYQSKQADIKFTEYDLSKNETSLRIMNEEADRLDAKYNDINQKLKEQQEIMRKSSYPNPEGSGVIIPQQTHEAYYNAQNQVSVLNREQRQVLEEITKQNELIDKQELKVNKLTAKYEKQKNDLSVISTKMQQVSADTNKFSISTENASKSASNVLKKITRWGLAIFGIRSAYMGIRQVMNSVLTQNQKLGDQMNGLKKSLYAAFTPIVEKIINLIRTLMAYINYVWKTLFGKELFSTKVSKDLKSGASSAKEIRKQLAGFDEANVLSDNKSSGGGGVGGGSTDLGFANVKIPDWLVKVTGWIKEHPKLTKILLGLAAFTILGGWVANTALGGWIGSLLGTFIAGAGATGLLGLLAVLLAIAGTVYLVVMATKGVIEVIKQVNELNAALEHRDELMGITREADKKYVDDAKKVLESDKSTTEQRKAAMTMLEKVTKSEMDWSHEKSIGVENNLKYGRSVLDNAQSMDELYKQGKLTKEEQYEYYKMLKGDLNPMLNDTNGWLFGNKEASEKLRESFEKLDKKYKTQYEVEMSEKGGQKVVNAIDKVRDAIDKMAKIKNITSTFAQNLAKVFHADGGIVNMPGRGVPLHVAGEAGREGIVPIDNESQMALLGSEIAKRVTINLTNVTQMNGRTISRELKTINNENDFMFNN